MPTPTSRTTATGTTEAVTTGSVSVPAGDIIFVGVGYRGGTATPPSVPTVSSSEPLTWTLIDSASVASGSTSARTSVFWAESNGNATTITVTPGGTAPSHSRISVSSVSGVSADFSNDNTGTSTSGDPSTTLPSSPGASSLVMGFVQMNGANAISPPAGFTELQEVGGGTHDFEVVYDDTSPSGTLTWSTSFFESALVAFEIKAAQRVKGSGAVALAGSGAVSRRRSISAAGAASLAAVAVLGMRRGVAAAASVTLGAAAAISVRNTRVAGFGAIALASSAALALTRRFVAGGASALSGAGAVSMRRGVAGSGAVTSAGAGALSVFHPEDVVGSNTVTLGGSGVLSRRRGVAGSGAINLGSSGALSISRDRRPAGAFAVVVEIVGWDPVAGAAVTLRASSLNDDRVCHLNAQVWWPTISKLPTLRYDLFDGAFTGRIGTPASSLSLAIEPWPNLARYALADARIRIWAGAAGDDFASYTLRFDGRVQSQPAIKDGIADVSFAVDDRWLDQPLLATYAGTGTSEGDAALKGQAKPLAIGAPRFVPGKLIDATNNVLQLSAYGTIEDVETAFERVARFAASVGDYASYAALVGATVRPGEWATSKANGLVRHGAPPQGLLSYHVKGDKAGPDGWVRLPGSVIRRIALLAGGSGKINDASLTALNASRPWNISLYVDTQVTARELIQRIAASVNAVAGVDWLGQLFVAPIGFAAATVTLDATGAALPPVESVQQLAIDAPWWKLALEAERTWLVHALDQVATWAQLVDLGTYVSTTTYREGNITQNQGASWVYINPTPSSGNAPPTLPTTSNTWWHIFANVGVTGNKPVTVYQRAASQPATPTGNGVPVGWALGLPGGTGIGWQSSSEQTQAGVLVGSWSTPARVTGDTGPTGATGATGATGSPGRDAVVHHSDIAPGGVPVVGDTWVTQSYPRVFRRWDGGAWVQILGDLAAMALIADQAYIGDLVVGTGKFANLSVTDLKVANLAVTIKSGFIAEPFAQLSTGSWQYIGSPAAGASVTTAASGVAANQRVDISANLLMVRDGGSNDRLSVRCLRSDGVQIDTTWDVEVTNDAASQPFRWTDYSPPAGSTLTYYVQGNPSVGSPFVNKVSVDVELVKK